MSYNGWSNRETWLVNVWFNPESRQDVDNAKYQIESDYDNLPDYLKDFIDINSIDWAELYLHFDDSDENQTED